MCPAQTDCVTPTQRKYPLSHLFFFNLQKRVSNGSCHIHHPGGPGGIPGRAGLAQSLLHDLWTFWFCFVIATSQFSLIRSVQPDSASPVHVSEGSNVVKRHSVNVSLLHCHVTVMTVM